jgi:DNA-binding NtrC family response regulator
MPAPRILVVEDEPEMRRLLEDELYVAGYDVLSAPGAVEALERLDSAAVDVVVTDLIMPGMKGNDLLLEIRARDPHIPVIIMTAFGSIDSAIESMKGGAYHYVTKPFRMEQLVRTIENALQERRLRPDPATEGAGSPRPPLVASSPAMRRAVDLIRRSAPARTPVLIVGESGTGKELLARTLHADSPWSQAPFVAVNCSAIPETLLESQLFGHRKGAFTDAREDRRGLFREADGGTVFLDEIGDMALALQGKILRVLQEKEVHPLGASAPVPVDVRVIAATHRDLEAACTAGRFRQDLYYRLNVITIRVPTLRERPEDLEPLVAHFLEKHGPRLGRPGVTVSAETMEVFRRHDWPGNVRELENVIERALVLGQGDSIRPEDLPDSVRPGHRGTRPDDRVRLLAEVECEQIVKALRSVRGNKAAAARLLGLDRKTLYRKIELYGIQEP